MKTKSLLDTMVAGPRAPHPHLFPFNPHTFERERVSAMQSVESLMAYQQFLADARAAKARRRRVSQAFERNVQQQSRQALSDLGGLLNHTLHTVGQINQTDFWSDFLQRSGAALADTGPMTANEIWQDMRGRPEVMSALAAHGLTNSMVAICDNVVATVHGVAKTTEGRLVFEIPPAIGGPSRTISLSPDRARPQTVEELLAQPSFNQLAAALSREDSGFVGVSSGSPATCDAGALLACGALATHQLMVDHVRKLEDTGLTVHAGGEPGTLIALAVIGLVLFIVGVLVVNECDPTQAAPLPDWACAVGYLLLIVGLILIAAGTAGALLPFVKSKGIAILAGVFVDIEVGVVTALVLSGFSTEQAPS
jgi:hypothetical protein